jgi:hypothetical protein
MRGWPPSREIKAQARFLSTFWLAARSESRHAVCPDDQRPGPGGPAEICEEKSDDAPTSALEERDSEVSIIALLVAGFILVPPLVMVLVSYQEPEKR